MRSPLSTGEVKLKRVAIGRGQGAVKGRAGASRSPPEKELRPEAVRSWEEELLQSTTTHLRGSASFS